MSYLDYFLGIPERSIAQPEWVDQTDYTSSFLEPMLGSFSTPPEQSYFDSYLDYYEPPSPPSEESTYFGSYLDYYEPPDGDGGGDDDEYEPDGDGGGDGDGDGYEPDGENWWTDIPPWMIIPRYEAFGLGYPGYTGERYAPYGGQYPTYQPQGGFPTYQGTSYQQYGGQYPTYGGYTSGLMGQGAQTISNLLGGVGVGIPYEQEQYQTAMGRITEAERTAQEELTRLAARGGRMESGLYGQQQQDILQQGLEAKRQTAQDFAITTAEMQQRAREAGVPMALGYGQFGAAQEQLMYETQANAWQAGQQEYTKAYESARQRGLDEYSAQQEGWNAMQQQQQIAQQSQERAWQAANTEYTKTYESAKQAGLEEYAAQKEAYNAALNEYRTTYQSDVMQSQQMYDWMKTLRTLTTQKAVAKMGVSPAASGGDIFAFLVSAFIKAALGQGQV